MSPLIALSDHEIVHRNLIARVTRNGHHTEVLLLGEDHWQVRSIWDEHYDLWNVIFKLATAPPLVPR